MPKEGQGLNQRRRIIIPKEVGEISGLVWFGLAEGGVDLEGLRRRQEDAWVRDQEPPARQARDTLVRGSFGFSSPLEGGKWGSE